jgi:hypothetical protein
MTKHSKPADAWNPWSTYIDAREEARRRGDRKVVTFPRNTSDSTS